MPVRILQSGIIVFVLHRCELSSVMRSPQSLYVHSIDYVESKRQRNTFWKG